MHDMLDSFPGTDKAARLVEMMNYISEKKRSDEAAGDSDHGSRVEIVKSHLMAIDAEVAAIVVDAQAKTKTAEEKSAENMQALRKRYDAAVERSEQLSAAVEAKSAAIVELTATIDDLQARAITYGQRIDDMSNALRQNNAYLDDLTARYTELKNKLAKGAV